jgi:group I intron endonuclease
MDLEDVMIIYKALLAHGYSNFTLEILEYCEPEQNIEREQYYLDLFKPEYNILKIAGSSLGHKRSKETWAVEKIRAAALSRSEETRAKLSEHLKNGGGQFIRLRLPKQLEHLAKLNSNPELIARKAFAVVVTSLESGDTIEYISMRQAARELGVHVETIRKHIKSQKPLLGKYQIIKKS